MEQYFAKLTENEMNVWLILGVCGLVLAIGVLRRKAEILLNLGVRAVTGTIAIYFVNGFLASAGISVLVGINPLTVLTTTFLGFPGVLALYGIHFCSLL